MKKDEAQTKWDVMDEVKKKIEPNKYSKPVSWAQNQMWQPIAGRRRKGKNVNEKKSLYAKQKIDRRKKKKIWEPRQIMANRSIDYGI